MSPEARRRAPPRSGERASKHIMPFSTRESRSDERRAAIVAKTIHRELREGGFSDAELVRLASELLGLVTAEVKGRRPAA